MSELATSAAADALWSFAAQVYAEPGIADALLDAQNRKDIDPNFILTLLFLCRINCNLTPERLQILARSTSDLREDWLLPTRKIRQSIPKDTSQTPCLAARKLLLEAELSFERAAQHEWLKQAAAWCHPVRVIDPTNHFEEIMTWLGSPISLELSAKLCRLCQSASLTDDCEKALQSE